MLVVVVVALGLAATYLVSWPQPATPVVEKSPAVDATTVDLPGNPPERPNGHPTAQSRRGGDPGADATLGRPAVAPAAPMPALPAPSPSRPASGAVAPPSSARSAATGSLLIRSTPADADVLVNGTARGKTPLTVRELPLGSYTIRIARDGYAAEDRKVQLTAERPTASMVVTLLARRSLGEGRRQASAAGTTEVGGLAVQSRPAGARVFVNNRLIGSTPLAIPGLPAGPATVRLEMDGYRTWTTTVRINAGEQSRVGASLERR